MLTFRKHLLSKVKFALHFHTSCLRKSNPLKWSYSMADTNRPLIGCTIGKMLQISTDKYGDTEAVLSCHQDIRKTFSQLNKDATDCAAGLLSLGFEPGDRIGIWSPNCYEWCVTLFAAAKAGLILVNINPGYRINELKYCLNKVGVQGLICATEFKTSNYYNMMTEVAPEILKAKPSTKLSIKELPELKYLINLGNLEQNGAFNFQNLFHAGRPEDKERVENLESQIQFDDPFNIQFTSGTTGSPKGAVLSHFNIVNNAKFVGIRTGLRNKKERIAICGPLYHCFGSIAGLVTNTFYGSTTILPSAGFDAVAVLKEIKHNRVTSVFATPTMFFDLLREYRANHFDIEHLHTGMIGGSACPENLTLTIMDELKLKNLIPAYGLTETSPALYVGYSSDSAALRASTVGYPLDQTESKIVDKNGRIVPIGNAGELLVRGYCIFLEYWGDEKKTTEAVGRDGWMKTGDIAEMDENKYLKIVGRINDMIIRGGENIYPAEIENFFLEHPDILEAQVFGVPDDRMLEEVAMCIISTNKNLQQDDVKKWAKEKISHFKIPRYVFLVEDFPKTISGKVKKFELRESFAKKLGL